MRAVLAQTGCQKDDFYHFTPEYASLVLSTSSSFFEIKPYELMDYLSGISARRLPLQLVQKPLSRGAGQTFFINLPSISGHGLTTKEAMVRELHRSHSRPG